MYSNDLYGFERHYDAFPSVIFCTGDEDTVGYDMAVSASLGTLFAEGDVEGAQVYLVANDAHLSGDDVDNDTTHWQLEDNLFADISNRHQYVSTEDYFESLIDGDDGDIVIVIDNAEGFFTADGFHTMERAAEWALGRGILIVAFERHPMTSRAVH